MIFNLLTKFKQNFSRNIPLPLPPSACNPDGSTKEMRFWAKVDKSPGHGPTKDCWVWTAALRSPYAYGQFINKNKNWAAHRYAWTLANSPIPDGKCVLHTCDNPPCVNPEHLFLGTQKEKSNRAAINGKIKRLHKKGPGGEQNSNSKLNKADVKRLRKLAKAGVSTTELLRIYPLSRVQINRIIRGDSWKVQKI